MRVNDIFIMINEVDLLENLNRSLSSKNIFIQGIEINHGILLKNIKYKIFKNINLRFDILKVANNKIYIEINKIGFKYFSIPKKFLDFFIKIIPIKIEKENSKGKFIFVFDLEDKINKFKTKLTLKNVYFKNGFIKIVANNVHIKNNVKSINSKGRGGLFLKITQTTLRISGEDIMSFIKDFIKTDSVMISGIDISQAIYIKGIIVNCFEVGDVSINIKDLRENLLYVQIKIINCVFPGVNIEHIPIKIFVKDILKAFNNWNLDFDLSSARFIDDCIEVKINNFNLDMRRLSSSSNNLFLK